MKISAHNSKRALRYIMAALAGILLTLAFPKWNLAGAAWVGPALMLFSAMGVRGKEAFGLGFLAGFVHFLTSLYWLLLIPYTFHGIPLGPGAGWLALSAYSALFPAAWVWICWKIFPGKFEPDLAPPNLTWSQKAFWCFACAAAWVGLEIARAHFLSGFPWNLLGNSQYKLLPLIQIASIAGVYAVSFLVVWTSVSIGMALVGMIPAPTPQSALPVPLPNLQSAIRPSSVAALRRVDNPQSSALLRDVLLPLFAVAGVVSFGAEKVFSKALSPSEVKVALVQPSIPQTVIWDPQGDTGRFDKVMEISKQALAEKPDVLIWPESAFPDFADPTFALAALTNLVASHGVWMILCANDTDPPTALGAPRKFYNASFLISPQGEIVNTYRKRRLVIFGEYVPLTTWLPFLKWFTPIEGGFTSGPGPVPFELGKTRAKTSVLICFEDVFPHEARDHVKADTDFLLNLTNDGWFGEGAAQWQQAISGVFRAVENGVPLVRCTNNGVTCWIDAQGRVHRENGPQDLYGPGFLVANIPLRETGVQTFYNQHGDWFAWGCAAITLLLALRSHIGTKYRARQNIV